MKKLLLTHFSLILAITGSLTGLSPNSFADGLLPADTVVVSSNGSVTTLSNDKNNDSTLFNNNPNDQACSEVIDNNHLVKVGDKWGMIDNSGNVVIPSEYDKLYISDDCPENVYGLKNNKMGALDGNGNIKIPFIYDDLKLNKEAPFRLFGYKADENTYTLISKVTGDIVTNDQYQDIHYFSEGLAVVKKDGKWGAINDNGVAVIPFQYDGMSDFDNGVANIYQRSNYTVGSSLATSTDNSGMLVGLIDKDNKVIIPAVYKDVYAVTNDQGDVGNIYVAETTTGQNKYIDITSGQQKLTAYHNIEGLNDVYYSVANASNKWGVVDANGDVILPFNYDYVYSYNNNQFVVEKNKKVGVVDENGKEILPYKYGIVQIDNGRYIAMNNKQFELLDENGNRLNKESFDYIKLDEGSKPDNQKFWVYKDNHMGLMDKNGLYIIPPKFTALYRLPDSPDKIIAKTETSMGVLDDSNRTLFPFKYYKIVARDDRFNTYAVQRDAKDGKMDAAITVDNTGNTVCMSSKNLKYDWIGIPESRKSGLIPYRDDGKYGFMNSSCNVVIAPKYSDVFEHDYYRQLSENQQDVYVPSSDYNMFLDN